MAESKYGPLPVAPHVLPEGSLPAELPCDKLVTLDDGRTFPLKKTICVPRGNLVTPAGPRVKLTAKLREETEADEIHMRKAAEGGWHNNMRELIKKGVDVNNRAQAAGATPLICASLKGKMDVIRMLVDAGADPTLGNTHCATPLSVAAQWNHIDVVRFLLEECNVDPRQADNSPAPVTPLDHAKTMQNDDMIELITKYWLKFDAKDEKVLSKKVAKYEKAKKEHSEKVSRDAEAKRQAAAA